MHRRQNSIPGLLRASWTLVALSSLIWVAPAPRAQVVDPLLRSDAVISDYADAEGRPRSAVTDGFGQLIDGIDAAGLQTTIDRNAQGNALTTMLPSGAVTTKTFDGSSNVTTRTDQTLGGTSGFAYEPNFSQISTVIDPFGSQTSVEYDTAGNATQLLTPEGREINSTYRADGLLDTLTDSLGTVAMVTYNNDLQPTDLTVGSGTTARSGQRSYTAEGYLDTDTDALGRVVDFDYDVLGRLTQATLPDARVITYDYDPAGNVTSVTPPGRTAYSYNYDNVGLLTSEVYPAVPGGGTNQVDYSYNATRQLTRITRADGVLVEFAYDAAGRTQTISQPNGDYTYNYDANTGQLTSLDSPDGVTQSFTYNNALVTDVSWSGAVVESVGYAYDIKGRITTLSIGGQDYAYAYNLDDDLTQAGSQTLNYDATTGLLVSTTLDTVNESFAYNQFAELTQHTVTSGATTLYDVQYSRDPIGRITQAIETVEGTTTTIDYSYDLAGRLSTVSEDTVLVATYNYDSNDNRIDNAATYDAQDRVTAQTGITYAYNAQGERTQKTEGGNITAYQYDAQGSMIGATLPDATQIDYLLDGQSRRVGKQVSGTTTESWLYVDALQPAARLDAANIVTQRYVYADRSTVPAYIDIGAAQYKIISDHLGSVRLIVDASDGSVVQRIDYDAWGNITADDNPGFQPFGYAGGLYDSNTGLTHFGLREYDPATSHWTSKDPIGFDGSPNNLYSYVEADPINQIDPTGLESSTEPANGAKVGKVLGMKGRNAWVTRADGTRSELRAGDVCRFGDRIEAGDDTKIVLEFAISGQVVISPDTTVEITGQRATTEVGNQLAVKARTFWAKIDKQKETLQVRAAGGVFGMEG